MQVIDKEEASLTALQAHTQEMCATLEALEALPDKISHDMMVPFGRVAMFPGLGSLLLFPRLFDAGL